MSGRIVFVEPHPGQSPREASNHETFLVDLGLPCQLGCVACERRAVHPSPSALDVARRRLLLAAEHESVATVRAVFYGGEPFGAPGAIARLANEVRTACRHRGAAFEPYLISTGVAWSAEGAALFSAAGVRRVQVTLAGTREVHDRLRPMKDGGGSFDVILRSL